MAERHGGMRRPQNPAPVSGPGQLSQRTDGGPQQVQADMSGMAYGENQAMEAIQAMAPMSASPSAASPRARSRQARQSGQSAGGMSATPLFAPTERPDEPVTAGAPFGPGDGPRPSMNPVRATNLGDTLLKLLPYDSDGSLSYLLQVARRRGW